MAVNGGGQGVLTPALPTLSDDDFAGLMQAGGFAALIAGRSHIALGLSGGPDSMALCYLLSRWLLRYQKTTTLHALIVDHGLRPESAKEARQVKKSVTGWAQVKPHILTWKVNKPEARIMEAARKARYALIQEYAAKHRIEDLFLAHHLDDQAETVLFRLAKGSGLDGLAGIRAIQNYETLRFCRPLLNVPKVALVALCDCYNLSFVTDPSNNKDQYARPRMRESMKALAREGLTAQRLSLTASRLARAAQALDIISKKSEELIIIKNNTKQIVLNLKVLQSHPHEIAYRIIANRLQAMKPDNQIRMENLESLVADLMYADKFRKRTLGGFVFYAANKESEFVIEREGRASKAPAVGGSQKRKAKR